MIINKKIEKKKLKVKKIFKKSLRSTTGDLVVRYQLLDDVNKVMS